MTPVVCSCSLPKTGRPLSWTTIIHCTTCVGLHLVNNAVLLVKAPADVNVPKNTGTFKLTILPMRSTMIFNDAVVVVPAVKVEAWVVDS